MGIGMGGEARRARAPGPPPPLALLSAAPRRRALGAREKGQGTRAASARRQPRGPSVAMGGEEECRVFVGGYGMERFPDTSKSPSPSRGFPQDPVHPQRHALHNLSGEERRGPKAQTAAGLGLLFPSLSYPGTPQPRENRGAPGERESRGRRSASQDVRPAAGRSPAQERAQARTARSRITRIGACSAGGCSLGAQRISRRPPPGVFIQTPVVGEVEVVVAAAAAAAAEEPSRIPGNVSAAPRPPHA